MYGSLNVCVLLQETDTHPSLEEATTELEPIECKNINKYCNVQVQTSPIVEQENESIDSYRHTIRRLNQRIKTRGIKISKLQATVKSLKAELHRRTHLMSQKFEGKFYASAVPIVLRDPRLRNSFL